MGQPPKKSPIINVAFLPLRSSPVFSGLCDSIETLFEMGVFANTMANLDE